MGGRCYWRKSRGAHHVDLSGARQQPRCRIPGYGTGKAAGCRSRAGRRPDDSGSAGSPGRASLLVHGSRRSVRQERLDVPPSSNDERYFAAKRRGDDRHGSFGLRQVDHWRTSRFAAAVGIRRCRLASPACQRRQDAQRHSAYRRGSLALAGSDRRLDRPQPSFGQQLPSSHAPLSSAVTVMF